MYKNLKDLTTALFERLQELDPDRERVAEVKGDPVLVHLAKCYEVYERAHCESVNLGYVGVGCITCAERAMIKYQETVKNV